VPAGGRAPPAAPRLKWRVSRRSRRARRPRARRAARCECRLRVGGPVATFSTPPQPQRTLPRRAAAGTRSRCGTTGQTEERDKRTGASKKQRTEPHEARCSSAPAEAELEGGRCRPSQSLLTHPPRLEVLQGVGRCTVGGGGPRSRGINWWLLYAVVRRADHERRQIRCIYLGRSRAPGGGGGGGWTTTAAQYIVEISRLPTRKVTTHTHTHSVYELRAFGLRLEPFLPRSVWTLSAAEPQRHGGPGLGRSPLCGGVWLVTVNAVACWLVGVEFGARRRAGRRVAWDLWGRVSSRRAGGGGGRAAVVRESLRARLCGLDGPVGERRVRFSVLKPVLRGYVVVSRLSITRLYTICTRFRDAAPRPPHNPGVRRWRYSDTPPPLTTTTTT
jgi:hypothetical protein